MVGVGRNSSGAPGKFTSPQESGFTVGQDSAQTSLETLAPGMVGQSDFDGATFDNESPFANEASFGGARNGSTSDLAEQMRTMADSPRTGAEQLGLTIPQAESSKPRHGDIFNSNDFRQQKRLNEIRTANPDIAQAAHDKQRATQTTTIPERETKSSTRLSAETYSHIRQQKTEEQRQKLNQLQRSHKTMVASGGINLTHNTTAQADSSEQGLLRMALKRFNSMVHREQQTAAQLAAQRRSKVAAHRGIDGGKERSGYGSAEFAQIESSHEWAGQDMGD